MWCHCAETVLLGLLDPPNLISLSPLTYLSHLLGVDISALPVLLAVLPAAHVDASIRPVERALALLFIIYVEAFVAAPILP